MNLEAEKCIKQMKKNRPKALKKEPVLSKVKKIGKWTITGPSNKDEFLKSMAFDDLEASEEQKCWNRNCAFALEVLSLSSKAEIKAIKEEVENGYSIFNKIHSGNPYITKKNQKMFNDDLYLKIADPKDYYSNEVLSSLKSA